MQQRLFQHSYTKPSSVQPALSNSSFHNQQRVDTRAAVHLAGRGSGTAPFPQIAPVQPPYKQCKAWGMRGITWISSLGYMIVVYMTAWKHHPKTTFPLNHVSCLNPQARVKDNDWFNQETIKSPDILKHSSTPSIGQELRMCLIIIIVH